MKCTWQGHLSAPAVEDAMGQFRRKSSYTPHEQFKGRHRFEHWYVDNQVYFITARCANRVHAFRSERAKSIFWDRFEHYTKLHGFDPYITSLVDNHYHTLGYLHVGIDLGPMMRKLHGSVAKLVNDTLETRLVPFWHDRTHHDYFDGCIRNEKQCRRAYRYTLTQGARHANWRSIKRYPHTRIATDIDDAVFDALRRNAFMEKVPYPRYSVRRPST